MVSFTVRMRFEHDDIDTVKEHLRRLTVASREEPGCVSYVAHTVEDEPSTILIYEQYADDAAVEHHRGTPHFHQDAIGGLYQLMKERQIERLVAIA